MPKTYTQLRDIAEFFIAPTRTTMASRSIPTTPMMAVTMGVEGAIFSYGGELGDYSTYKIRGIINSEDGDRRALRCTENFTIRTAGLGKDIFPEDNQAITEGLAAMSMNFFAFFPALANKATNPNADVTGYFANPAGPTGKHGMRRLAARASRSSLTPRNRMPR